MRRALLLVPALLLLSTASPAHAAAVKFTPCLKAKDFDCAKVRVPLDYDKPSGAQLKIAVSRLPAKDRKHKLGSIFINYGGPCCGAIYGTQQFGAGLFAPLRKRFDLIAFDPRGTGYSRPLLRGCDVNEVRQGVFRVPFTTPATFSAQSELRKADYYAHRCERRNRRLAAHMGTGNVARDIDHIRARMGLERIDYFGFSYGTQLGATYAALFGDHLRSAVLDGALNPTEYINAPVDTVLEQSKGFEDALDRYFAGCKRKRSECRWSRGGPPERVYDRLVKRADASPLPLRKRGRTPGKRRVDGDLINLATIGGLYSKFGWPGISAGLDEIRFKGTAQLVRAGADSAFGRQDDGSFTPYNDRFYMISAGEQVYPEDPQIYFDNGARVFNQLPHFYSNTGYTDLNWARYRPLDADRFDGPFKLPGSTPAPLVIGTTHDPATPYVDAEAMAKQLGHARLLTMEGDGHTAFGGNSACIDRAVVRYMTTLKLPARGKKCRQQVPFKRPPDAEASAAGGASSVTRGTPPAPLTAPFTALTPKG